jgi:hypothetical protein
VSSSYLPSQPSSPSHHSSPIKQPPPSTPPQVELQPTTAIPCIVSFAPGQERRVYFAVSGEALRKVQDALASETPLAADAAAVLCVVHSSPAVVLADPAPNKLNAGEELSSQYLSLSLFS